MKNIYCFLLVLGLVSCQDTNNLKKITGSALGTSYQVAYYGHSNKNLVQQGMDSIFEAINASMSTYQDNSLLSKFNNGDSILIDSMFKDVFLLAKQVHKKSNGYFDPTVGNLVNAYGFGSQKNSVVIDSLLIDSLKQYVGFDMIKLKPDNTIVKDKSGIYLELNAIAKGYCLDRMAVFLDANNVDDYLIELGGELVAKGKKQETDSFWVAGIEAPNKDGTRSIAKTVLLKNRAMATSGNYRKFKIDTLTGKKYVHTINPLTGYPEENDLLSASVFAPNCAQADAYATAFMAMGYQKSREVLKKTDSIDVYFMYLDSLNNLKEFASPGIVQALN